MVKKNYNSENQLKAWYFLLPALLAIFVFNIYPLFRAFFMSFQKGTLINPRFAGFENYQRLFSDPVFFRALKNTAFYSFTVVPIALILSLGIAWVIFEKVKYKSFFEAIFLCLMLRVRLRSVLFFAIFSTGHTGSSIIYSSSLGFHE